jgi:5'-phosphate synthase pdxT subunit
MAQCVGVLGLQGDFLEHIQMLQGLGVDAVRVVLPRDLEKVDALIIPGGESTTISRLMETFDLKEPIKERARRGMPVWGTCAGMIVASTDVPELDREPLGLIDLRVRRNAFGRQIDSFTQDIDVKGVEGGPYKAVFIRAPVIETAGDGVEVLAHLEDGRPVAARQGAVMVTAFHPELTKDARIHALFLKFLARDRGPHDTGVPAD